MAWSNESRPYCMHAHCRNFETSVDLYSSSSGMRRKVKVRLFVHDTDLRIGDIIVSRCVRTIALRHVVSSLAKSGYYGQAVPIAPDRRAL